MLNQPAPAGAPQTKTPLLPAEGFVRISQVLAVVPVSRTTLWRWVKEGKFPASVKLTPEITAWPVQAVRAWIAERNQQPA